MPFMLQEMNILKKKTLYTKEKNIWRDEEEARYGSRNGKKEKWHWWRKGKDWMKEDLWVNSDVQNPEGKKSQRVNKELGIVQLIRNYNIVQVSDSRFFSWQC